MTTVWGRGAAVPTSVVVLLLAVIAPAHAARDDLVLVSRVSGASGAAANASSTPSAISADGRFVAFSSSATNLSDETGGHEAVFVRDLEANTTTLASRATGAGGEGPDALAAAASISADGQRVAFESRAKNLSADDADEQSDAFVRDRRTATTTLLSRTSGATGAGGNGDSGHATISGDGRRVAFLSYADNLSDADNDSDLDVFVRDLSTNATILVSRATDGTPADSGSGPMSISADGRFIAFSSDADNLSSEDDDDVRDVFVRDLTANTTTYVSRAEEPGDDFSEAPSISADGRFVAFLSHADGLSTQDDNSVVNVFVRDLQANTTTYVSRAAGASGQAADSDSLTANITADGRFVLFSSRANNLSREDNDEFFNVFVRDLETNALAYVSRAAGPGGGAAEGSSVGTGISGDGRYVLFLSNARNLSGDDEDDTIDTFVRDLLGGPAGPAGPSLPPVAQPTPDTTGPSLRARGLARANRAVRVSRTGRLKVFCGRFAEPVTVACGVRGLATRRFTAAAGKRTIARFRLSRARLRQLGAARRLPMRAVVVARDPVGNATTVRFRITVVAPKPLLKGAAR